MRAIPCGLLMCAVAAVFCTGASAQPPSGSQLTPDENLCATCHGEKDLWDEDKLHLWIPLQSLAEDVHFSNGVNCHDCHGGDPTSFEVPQAHSTVVDDSESGVLPFQFPFEKVWQSCGKCHSNQETSVADSVHRLAGDETEPGRTRPLECGECHGKKAHGMLAVRDSRSPVFVDKQVQVCGRCHEQPLAEYMESPHGHGLEQSGLLVTAVCADCHAAHAVLPKTDERSTLHPTRVADTCATCHRFIQERLEKSVHGRGNEPGGTTEEAASGADVRRRPSCIDCHVRHDSGHPQSTHFRLGSSGRCGDCHATSSSSYSGSMHGELTELGYEQAANCSDCHGAHDILPLSDPASRLSSVNRRETCQECHPHAAQNFLDFDPHADHHDPKRDLVVYCVYVVLITFLISTFSFFGVHSILWFVRGLIDVLKNGRPPALTSGSAAYVRFKPLHRGAHLVMALSFLGLALTGLPLKYSHYQWAHTLARALGGFESTGVLHRFCGILNIGVLVFYVFWMLGRLRDKPRNGVPRSRSIFGPDSPVPNLRDVKDCLKMIRWFFGLGQKPTFERWSYWEKYDFWGACADILAIGLTGLILWFPNFFCMYLPGKVLNIAKVIHSTQALLATGFVFAIHFFNTHLRPEKFPMDMSVLTGIVSEQDMHEERPEFLERLRHDGKLDELKTTVPSRRELSMAWLGGLLALGVGLALLAGILLSASEG